MDRKSVITGLLFIAAGLLILGDNLNFFTIDWESFFYNVFDLWPLIMIAIGGGLWFRWLQNRSQIGNLLPGTILLTYGCLFLYLTLSNDWWQMGEYNLWAFFILGPGLGFLAMYLLGTPAEHGHLVTGLILVGIGTLFLGGIENIRMIVALILVGIGLRLLLRSRNKDKGNDLSSIDE